MRTCAGYFYRAKEPAKIETPNYQCFAAFFDEKSSYMIRFHLVCKQTKRTYRMFASCLWLICLCDPCKYKQSQRNCLKTSENRGMPVFSCITHPDTAPPDNKPNAFCQRSLLNFLYFSVNQQVTLLFGVSHFDFYFFIFLIFNHLCIVCYLSLLVVWLCCVCMRVCLSVIKP